MLLDDGEPVSKQQAAGLLGVDRTTTVGLIDSLEAKSLVVRRPDPEDRRRNVVALTETGLTTLAAATLASDEAERNLLEPLDEADAEHLRDLLGVIAATRSRRRRQQSPMRRDPSRSGSRAPVRTKL